MIQVRLQRDSPITVKLRKYPHQKNPNNINPKTFTTVIPKSVHHNNKILPHVKIQVGRSLLKPESSLYSWNSIQRSFSRVLNVNLFPWVPHRRGKLLIERERVDCSPFRGKASSHCDRWRGCYTGWSQCDVRAGDLSAFLTNGLPFSTYLCVQRLYVLAYVFSESSENLAGRKS